MARTVYIPIIAESDYDTFRSIGVRSQFPDDYGAFLQLVEQEKEKFRTSGCVTKDVNVNTAGFKKWLAARKQYPTYSALLTYTASLVK